MEKNIGQNKIISFSLLQTVKGREKICQCNPPHYEIDPVNRTVTCKDCGAIIDPINALITICEHTDKLAEYQREALQKARTYAELADKEFRRRIKNKACKDMDKNYCMGLLPVCPKCGETFDPTDIMNYSRPEKRKE